MAFKAKRALEAQREGVTATRSGGCRPGKRKLENPPPNVAGGVAETQSGAAWESTLASTRVDQANHRDYVSLRFDLG